MTIERIRRHILQEHPQDAARVLEQFTTGAVTDYLRSLPAENVAGLFQHLSPSMASDCLAEMATDQTAAVLQELDVERAAIYMRRLDKAQRSRLLSAMPAFYASMLRLVLRYPDGSVGQLMDPNPVTVNYQSRVENVITLIRDNNERLENEIYVVDEQHKLAGVVNIKDLIAADETETISKIMLKPRYTIPARSRLTHVYSTVGNRYRDFYPVIDHNSHFIGVLRYEILLEAFSDGDSGGSGDADLTAGLFIMADLFWKSFLNLLMPGEQSREKRGPNE